MDEMKIKNETPNNYDVGYGKPPKHSRFPKGVSGNPKGRPKVAPDFDAALLREVKTRITITENGRRVRVSKYGVIIKQFVNNAMKGKTSDLRLFRDVYQGASEKAALAPPANADSAVRAADLTDDQLARIVAQALDDPDPGDNK
jgi:hypothetical protein